MGLPDENPTYTKIDDGNFYLSRTTSEQINVAAVQDAITAIKGRLQFHLDLLASASAAGVASADDAITNAKDLIAQIKMPDVAVKANPVLTP